MGAVCSRSEQLAARLLEALSRTKAAWLLVLDLEMPRWMMVLAVMLPRARVGPARWRRGRAAPGLL
jgi:hypothetical protein